MDLFQLHVFCSLANTLNYKKTAAELNITQPAVSYHIKSLEQELQISLLNRNRRQTELSAAGVEFLHYAESMCSQERLAKERMKQIREGNTGRLTIAGIQTYLSLISDVQSEFLKTNPKVQIDTYILNGPELLQSHQFSEYDIYICAENMISANPQYENEVLKEEYMELYFHEDLADRIDPDDWSSFSDVPFVSIIPSNRLLYSRISTIMRDNSYEPLLINRATTIESVLSLVKNGCGITILPGGSDPDPKKNHLRTIQIRHPASLIRLTVSQRRSADNPLISEIMKLLHERC